MPSSPRSVAPSKPPLSGRALGLRALDIAAIALAFVFVLALTLPVGHSQPIESTATPIRAHPPL